MPPQEYVTDEAELLASINENHAALFSQILSVLREIRVILQGMADRGA